MRIPTRKPGKYARSYRDPYMTKAKFDELTAELARLLRIRPNAANEVKRLAEMGDFSENAAYQLAKGRLRGINQRILETEDHLKFAKIISRSRKTGTVELGSTVTISLLGKEQTFTVLGPTEANPSKGIISFKSPLGAVIMGKCIGDKVLFQQGKKNTEVTIVRIA